MVERRKVMLLGVVIVLAATSWLTDVLSLLPKGTSSLFGLVAAVLGVLFIGHSAIGTLMDGVFGIDVLAAVAIIASIYVGEYIAAAVVVIMLGGGEVLEDIAFSRATSAIEKLVEDFPQTAFVVREGGEVEVPISEIEVGETVIVKPGGMIPVDGVIRVGKATVNQASVTGESLPVEKAPGDDVFSGTMVELGALEVETTAVGDKSTYGQIISMVREAQIHRAPIVSLADKFAGYYIPVILVIGVAVLLWTKSPLRMASVFIIACPCALTLATPTAVVASIGNSARKGILIRNGESLELLGSVDTLVVDKTGTITSGKPTVVDVKGYSGYDATQVLSYAAGAERHSEHPIARAVLARAEEDGVTPLECSEFEVYPGLGVCVTHEGSSIVVGSEKLLRENGIALQGQAREDLETEEATRSVIFVVVDGQVVGSLMVSDTLREGVREVLAEMKRNGVKKTVMLTGDKVEVAESIGAEVGIDVIEADLMPDEKVERIHALKAGGSRVLMVGDGINDAPALAAADVGVAMGLTGTDIAMETAGITLATDRLDRLPTLLRIGKETMKVVKLNIAFAMLVNFLGITLSIMGIVTPLMASLIHESNAMIVMLNALRLLRVD